MTHSQEDQTPETQTHRGYLGTGKQTLMLRRYFRDDDAPAKDSCKDRPPPPAQGKQGWNPHGLVEKLDFELCISVSKSWSCHILLWALGKLIHSESREMDIGIVPTSKARARMEKVMHTGSLINTSPPGARPRTPSPKD